MKSKYIYTSYIVLFLFYCLLIPKIGHYSDTECWIGWSELIFSHGLTAIYPTKAINYLPLYHYFLLVYGLLNNSLNEIRENIHLLKIFTLIFEFIGGVFVFKFLNSWFNDKKKAFLLSLFYFLNIFLFYNSLAWGQIDGILASLVFISFFFAIRKKSILAIIFLVLAINLKLQAIIFIPFLFLLILNNFLEKPSIISFFWLVSVPVFLQIVIVLPYILAAQISEIWYIVTSSFEMYPSVSMNAFNFWYLFFDDPVLLKDSFTVFGIALKKWGLLFFFSFSVLALFPLIKQSFFKIFMKIDWPVSNEKKLLIGGLIPLLFFFFNTEMHERYSHPAFIFLITYCIVKRNFFWIGLMSFAYCINLEYVCRLYKLSWLYSFPHLGFYIGWVYLALLIFAFFELFKTNIMPLNRDKEKIAVL